MADGWEDLGDAQWETLAPAYKPRIDPATIVEPNAEQRRMGIRKNRIKDDDLARKAGAAFLDAPEAFGTSIRDQALINGLPAGVANTAGFVGEMGANLLPIPIGGAKTKLALQTPAGSLARDMMWRALKPGSAAQLSGEAERAIQTLLTEPGARVSEAGVKNLTKLINGLDTHLDDIITNSTNKASTDLVVRPIKDAIKQFRAGLDHAESKAAVLEQMDKFMSHPYVRGALDIPVQTAQEMKRAIDVELGSKAFTFGVKGDAEKSGKMAIRNGLRQSIEYAEPSVGPINAEMSNLINARDLAEKRALMAHNLHLVGLGWINPKTLIPWMIERSPATSSILARSLYRGTPSGILGELGVGGAELLNEAQK